MIFEYFSKNKILIVISFIILLAGICFIYFNQTEQVYCTQEAKICPDGSAVGRIGPDCEFAVCPISNQLEKAITDYLLTQSQFSWETKADSQKICVIENLSEAELFPKYVWAYCVEYDADNGKILSGSSLPAKIDYPNELSFYDIEGFSYEIPGDGSKYSEDVKRIFPQEIQQKIFNFDSRNIIEKAKAIIKNNISN
ncbi:MAG: hypothetical protein WC938_00495 [Candidatus Paceibacterota bacterium]|jgi:hypothetical protein